MRTVVAALLLTGCAATTPCPLGTTPATVAQLFLGRAIDATAEVDAAAWARFLDEEVTPRFPAGHTALAAEGRWRAPEGDTVREASRVLLLVLPGQGPAAAAPAVFDLATAYRARFRQRGVLITLHAACAAT